MSLTNTPLGNRWRFLRARSWAHRSPPPWRPPRRHLPGPASGPLTVPDVVAVNRLMYCLERNRREGGHAPGVDGLRYHDMGRQEASRALGRLKAAVLDGSFRPQPDLPVDIPKKDHGRRRLLLRVVTERALATSMQYALASVFAPSMSPLTHSVGGTNGGVGALLADLAAVHEFGTYGVLLNLDVLKAFDSVPIDPLMAVVERCVPDSRMRRLIEVLLRGADHRPMGIPQGLAISPQHLELYMSAGFDRYWSNAPGMPFLLRYVDNLPCLARNVDEGREVVERCASLLRDMGLALKPVPEGDYFIDLDGGMTTELLGFTVSTTDGKLKYDVSPAALENLQEGLHDAHGTINPSLTAKAVMEGWITAVGPAFSRSQSDVLDDVLNYARRQGFREFSRESLVRTWSSAYGSWDARFLQPARKRARERTGVG